ncbi:SDR family NAD(P)-dependent oxidoreductase [Geobacter sp. FeAm09]|uniref:SDR family NAD(P)-dependent oxidoreductase n=1 Tax=Geobacter sp. FeAm09 TaxID=2597769 RepID=UPI0011EC95BE|nr:SDR family NAD(P)-dependent oxidoreductase [Geobacter sp. FeAm09]QEM67464.1 SDR family NAD(P)-dependent oxidoreductase [Geobacter sp. FeAm09]
MKKTTLITGCSSGIGKAAARLFASRGWNVVAAVGQPEGGAGLKRLDNVLVAHLDALDRDSIDQAIEAGIGRFGRIDALINNPGHGRYGMFEAIPREKIHEQFDVTLFGVMGVTRALLPHFRANGQGLIINTSSGAGIFTLPMTSLYCASRLALEGFSEALARELAPQNIAVKMVLPHGGAAGVENPARRGDGELPRRDYDDFVRRTNAAFAAMSAARAVSAADVALALFEAATDGTQRLRYLVGADGGGAGRDGAAATARGARTTSRKRVPARNEAAV